MSSDEDVLSPPQRALGSKTAPVTPDGSESEPDDVEEEEKNIGHSYARPRIRWVRMALLASRNNSKITCIIK